MCQGFSNGQSHGAFFDLPFEQCGKAIHCTSRLRQMIEQAVEAAFMAFYNLVQARVQAVKGRFMRGQHQQVIG